MTQAWSYSALDRFETCGELYYRTRIKKDVIEPPSEAGQWGDAVHRAFEARLREGVRLPDILAHHEPLCARLSAMPGERLVEWQLALNEQLQETRWFGRGVFVRAKLDYVVINPPAAIIVDWKTGRLQPDFAQLELSAVLLMFNQPNVDRVKTLYVWLKDKDITTCDFHRDDIPHLWSNWLRRSKALDTAVQTTDFRRRPNGLCRKYCPVKDCPHNGR